MKWTREMIAALSSQGRTALLKNALQKATPEAEEITSWIVELDASTRPAGGLRRDHPTVQAMEAIIRSVEGRKSARKASDAGLPALAGVDHMLALALGAKYGGPDTTSWAGVLVAEVMEETGYVQTKKKPMPDGCVAKRAAFFVTRVPIRS